MSSVQHKLFAYSEMPPPSAWEGIAAALDEAPAFAQKLYQFETAPPAAVWGKVAQQLTPPQTKVIPLRTRLFKYAIAAAVLIAVATGSIFYLTNSNAPNLATQPKPGIPETKKNTLLETQTSSGSKTAIWQKEDEANEDDKGLITETNFSDGALVRFSSRIRIAKKQRMPAGEINVMPEEMNIIDTERSNRYMIAMTAGGKAVRLPKKAYSDYACADAYADRRCKEKIASIQSKMAASVSTDFTDFMDLLKKLQDN